MFSESYRTFELEASDWEGTSDPLLPARLFELICDLDVSHTDSSELLVCGLEEVTLRDRTHKGKYHTYGTLLSDMIDNLEKVDGEFRNPFYWAEQADFKNPSMLVYDLSRLEPAYNDPPNGDITAYGQRYTEEFGADRLDYVTFGTARGNLDPAALFGVRINFA